MMIETIWSTHPILTIVSIWIALELMAYVAISIGLVWRHLRHGFSWPRRAIRNARYFF